MSIFLRKESFYITTDLSCRETWQKTEIFDRSVRTFKATIGPSGGKRGYQGITGNKLNYFRLSFIVIAICSHAPGFHETCS